MALDPKTKSFIVNRFPAYADQLDSFSSIPGFDLIMQNRVEMFTGYSSPGMGMGNARATALGIINAGLKAASTDPVAFVKSAMKDSIYSGDTNLLKSEIQYLQKNNVPIEDIKARYTEIATQKAQGEADYAAARAAMNQGGGGLFGGITDFLASIDPSTAISKAATDLFQPIEQTISQNLAQLDKDLSLSQNAPLLAAIAVSVAAPGVGSAIGQQMIAAGLIPATTSAAVATAIGTGVANAALQVAQGKSAEDALKGAVVGGVAGFAGGQVGDYLVGDPGAVKNFVSSTAANMVAGKDPETAAKNALIQTGIQGTADVISTAQAEKYIQNLPIPDYLDAGPAPTSADTIVIYPDTNPNLVNTTLSDITTLPAGTVEGINATLPTTVVTDTPVDYSLAPATKAVTVDDVVKNIVLDNLDTSLQTGTLTADQVDTALNTLTGGYTLGGTTEGIKATLPDTVVTGTEPVDYTLNVLTGGEGLTLPTSPNLDIMGGGQGLTANVDGGVLSEEGITRTGDVILGDPNSFINTTLPLSTDTIDTSTKTDETSTDIPLTKDQVEAMIKLAVTLALADQAKNVITDATTSGNTDTTITGNPYIPSDISGWARPEYTKTWQSPLDLNSLFTTDNLLGGTQWAGLQGNQFANIPQVSMSDFISSIQNGKV